MVAGTLTPNPGEAMEGRQPNPRRVRVSDLNDAATVVPGMGGRTRMTAPQRVSVMRPAEGRVAGPKAKHLTGKLKN
jgi:hypothetical protein